VSIINKLASRQGIKSDLPNQQLAKEIVETNNTEGIKEIAENLKNKDRKIQSDCIKVLYEIGYLRPELISEYVHDFLKLLTSKNNRLVWGGMIAVATIAVLKANELFAHRDELYLSMEKGSVITIDNAVKALAKVAAHKEEYNQEIFPFLITHLKTCRPKDLPQHAESVLVAVNLRNKDQYLAVLQERADHMSSSQLKRIQKLNKKLEEI
jgi:hypothetical protein